jgi:hypothetical protein
MGLSPSRSRLRRQRKTAEKKFMRAEKHTSNELGMNAEPSCRKNAKKPLSQRLSGVVH